jgi:dynein light chain roadblock-type
MSEVDERISRIQQHKGIVGLLIVTYKDDEDGKEGVPVFVKSTMKPSEIEQTKLYGVYLSKLAVYARNLIRDLDPKNDLTFLRVQCKKYEMMIAPDKEYFLIVINNTDQQNAAY